MADCGLCVSLAETGDLLAVPCLGQLGLDKDPSGIGNARPVFAALYAFLCKFVGLLGPVASVATVVRHLSAYGRLMPAHQADNVTVVMSSLG